MDLEHRSKCPQETKESSQDGLVLQQPLSHCEPSYKRGQKPFNM